MKVLRVGILSPVLSLDPRLTFDAESDLVLRQVFESPYELGGDGRMLNCRIFEGPLKRIANSSIGRIFSARVRSGIRFSDGTQLTADYVAESLSKVKALSALASLKVEDRDVIFTPRRIFGRIDLFLTQIICAITLEKDGQLLGTGAFRPAPTTTPELFRLIRNPYYWSDTQIDEIVFKVYPPTSEGRPESLVKAIREGEVDFTDALPASEVDGLPGMLQRREPGCSTAILYFNTERVPDPGVRRALAMAVDRRELTELCHGDASRFTAGCLLPQMMAKIDDEIPHDRQQARKILTEAGDKPRRLRLMVIWGPRPYLPYPKKVAETLARQFAEVGVEVTLLAPHDSDEYCEILGRGDYDLTLAGWIADTPDAADFLEVNLSSALIPRPEQILANTSNEARWDNIEVDAALANYRADPAPQTLRKILGMVTRDVPLLPLMYGPTLVVHRPYIQGFHPPAFGLSSLAHLRIENKLENL